MPDELRSSHAIVSEVIDNGNASTQQYLVVVLCLLFNMLDGFDITAMAIVASPVSTDLDLTTDKVGWIFSFALFGMMLGAMILAPVEPTGCPRPIPEPFTFVISRFKPSSFSHPMYCAAKASFTSTRSKSLMASPLLSIRFLTAGTGDIPMTVG